VKIFLDANVLFSAARSAGPMRALIELAQARGHECWADAYVVEEARRNLAIRSPAAIADLEALSGALLLAPTPTLDLPADAAREGGFEVPEKDRPVLAAAIRLRCDLLVTGDRTHFGRFYGRRLAGVEVLAPRTLAERLVSGRSPRSGRPDRSG
jgi:predicted nucleic acid-binding protein